MVYLKGKLFDERLTGREKNLTMPETYFERSRLIVNYFIGKIVFAYLLINRKLDHIKKAKYGYSMFAILFFFLTRKGILDGHGYSSVWPSARKYRSSLLRRFLP